MGINLNKPLERGSAEFEDLLKSLQGNILQSHGRDEAFHIFISFGAPTAEANTNTRTWIRNLLAEGHSTTAFQQDQNGADRSGTFQTLLLSSEGYEFLDEKRPRDGSFRDGMRDRGDRLNDPKPTTWEADYRYEDDNKQAHALLIVADNDVPALEERVKSVSEELTAFGAEVLVAERGHQQRNNDGKAVEHFGYRDGVSQPLFIVEAGDDPETQPGGVKFDQRTPLKRVLEEDRLAKGHYGSFLVYRKLEQDVDSFNEAVKKVANQLGQSENFVGAQAIGRFKNGTPLALSGVEDPNFSTTGEGRFDYDDDDGGDNWPLHAHIRKVNPRNSLGFFRGIFSREKTTHCSTRNYLQRKVG